MLDEIRKHIPATRRMSDGRLTAISVAAVILLFTLADFDKGFLLMGAVGAAFWYMMHQRSAGRRTEIRLAPPAAVPFDAFEPAMRPARMKEVTVRPSTSDPLVARAEALLARVEARV